MKSADVWELLMTIKWIKKGIVLVLLGLFITPVIAGESISKSTAELMAGLMIASVHLLILFFWIDFCFSHVMREHIMNLRSKCRCPFFGFWVKDGNLIDKLENGCALNANSNSRCLATTREENPDWLECHFNNERDAKILSRFCSGSLVAIKHINSMRVMPFGEWFRLMMIK